MLSQSEIRMMIFTELGATQYLDSVTTADPTTGKSVWDSWWTLSTGSGTDAVQEQRLKVRVLSYLEGKYHARYDISQGTERRAIHQQWVAVSKMLDRELARLSKIDTLYSSFKLNATRITPYTATEDPEASFFASGKGSRENGL